MEFFHGEHLRMDWGLGNPNKTAALIACLMVLAHTIRYILPRKWGLAVFTVVFLGLGICLVHTYSRGGVLAAVAGQLAFWATRSRCRFSIPPRAELICGIALLVILSVYSALPQVGAASRYTQGVTPADEDRSITNRLRIWKDVPAMMVAAPRGWGLKKAGVSWMQWYQPVETRYQYRTLVNSHLTWLVELGWVGRFFYLFLWGMVFAIAFARPFGPEKKRERRSAAVVTGLWTSFAVSAFFSSVGETWVLWVLPVAGLIWMIYPIRTLGLMLGPTKAMRPELILMASLSLVTLLSCALIGRASASDIPVFYDGKQVFLGEKPYKRLLLKPDEEILGQHYGILLRENLDEGWIICDSFPKKSLPEGLETLILSGNFPDLPETLEFGGEIVVLNSSRELKKSGQGGKKRVILGSYRKDPIAESIRYACADEGFGWDLEKARGKKMYLGNWIKYLESDR